MLSLNHLEWRLDPTSPSRIPEATGTDVDVVLFCDEGYCSSLAAGAACTISGCTRATDMIGGFQALARPRDYPSSSDGEVRGELDRLVALDAVTGALEHLDVRVGPAPHELGDVGVVDDGGEAHHARA